MGRQIIFRDNVPLVRPVLGPSVRGLSTHPTDFPSPYIYYSIVHTLLERVTFPDIQVYDQPRS